jgi:putative heme-binding domain-containing protein
LQERAADPAWKRGPVHAALRFQLESAERTVPERLRGMWALWVTGGLDEPGLRTLLKDPAEHVRAWAVQLLCEQTPTDDTLQKLAEMARTDASAVVRLYLASALQRMDLDRRWPIAAGLCGHAEDAQDANLPLMIWYGIEPLVPTDPAAACAHLKTVRIPLVRRFIARRLADEAVTRGKKIDLAPLVQVLAPLDETAQLDILQGIREGFRGSKSVLMPDGWPALYARLAGNAPLRDHAVVLALTFGDPQAVIDLRRTVEATDVPSGERARALQTLINHRVPDLGPWLQRLLADAELRGTALRGLAGYADATTPKVVLALYPKLSHQERQDAIAMLASRKEYALSLLAAVRDKAVPAGDISAFVARQLYALGDPNLTEQLRRHWGEVRDTAPQKKEQIAKYKKMLSASFLSRADLDNGRALFAKTCQQCHQLHGEGGKIGPDLTGANRANLDYLLTNLVDPSAEVANDYRISIITTRDGRVLTGMIIARAGNRITLQTPTQQIVLTNDEIEETRASPQSMMPEGILDALTRDQVRDLIAYVAGRAQP